MCFKVKRCPQVGTILSIHFSTCSRFLLNHFPICTLVIRCRVPPRPLGMAHGLHVSNTCEFYHLQQKPKSFKTTIQGKVPFLFAYVNAHPLYFENRYVSTIQSTLALIKSTCYTLKSLLDSVQLLVRPLQTNVKLQRILKNYLVKGFEASLSKTLGAAENSNILGEGGWSKGASCITSFRKEASKSTWGLCKFHRPPAEEHVSPAGSTHGFLQILVRKVGFHLFASRRSNIHMSYSKIRTLTELMISVFFEKNLSENPTDAILW